MTIYVSGADSDLSEVRRILQSVGRDLTRIELNGLYLNRTVEPDNIISLCDIFSDTTKHLEEITLYELTFDEESLVIFVEALRAITTLKKIQ